MLELVRDMIVMKVATRMAHGLLDRSPDELEHLQNLGAQHHDRGTPYAL